MRPPALRKPRRLLAKLHQVRTARIGVAGGGAGGDAPVPQATALGLPCGQPQPPKRPFPQRFAINHGGDQRGVSNRGRIRHRSEPFPARNRSFGSRRVHEVLDPGQVLVEPGELVDHRLNRERCFDMFAPGCAQTASEVGIADDVANCPGQKLGVGHGDENPGLAVDHDLGGSGWFGGSGWLKVTATKIDKAGIFR